MPSLTHKVPFSMENFKKCRCPNCPVQQSSQCAKKKLDQLKSVQTLPDKEKTPTLYCSSGTAECNDLDMEQMCICASCPVWEQYDLSKSTPTMYFCRDGEAK